MSFSRCAAGNVVLDNVVLDNVVLDNVVLDNVHLFAAVQGKDFLRWASVRRRDRRVINARAANAKECVVAAAAAAAVTHSQVGPGRVLAGPGPSRLPAARVPSGRDTVVSPRVTLCMQRCWLHIRAQITAVGVSALRTWRNFFLFCAVGDAPPPAEQLLPGVRVDSRPSRHTSDPQLLEALTAIRLFWVC